MKVSLSYVMVVLIWASTPLGIKFSNDSLSFLASAAARVSLALCLALLVLLIMRKPLFKDRGDWKVYFSASLGIFPSLPLVYWAVQFIPSGLISVLFGLTPFATGIMTMLVMKTNPFSLQKLLGLLMALAGLLLIFQGQIKLGTDSVYGVVAVLLSLSILSYSSVLLQRHASSIEPLRQAAGALFMSLPGLLLSWLLLDGELPENISTTSIMAVVYLAVFGSLLGYPAYFYLLKHLSASTISLTTLMTPGLALMLGAVLAGEKVQEVVVIGAVFILFSLLFYLGFISQFLRWLWRKTRLLS